ncbi:RidA family protein [Chryseolinea lacunae]|uniref:RidA family protein n=1 Tax=Chryseolinea lacunae TaxID=2801331 RepID=A0ABS1KXE8_9BACT|nr:RidA family protein [Chryseolinea lacunae]MBL0744134.1 RidA family protein [Chryseolinea lacunae]
MPIIQHTPEGVFPPYRNYSHAVEVKGDARLLFISGLNGYHEDGQSMPDAFEAQGELIWKHIGTILKSAAMDYTNIISVRTYLADPSFDEANVQLRMKYLGNNKPSLTVICCQLLEKKWKLEVEVVAAKD